MPILIHAHWWGKEGHHHGGHGGHHLPTGCCFCSHDKYACYCCFCNCNTYACCRWNNYACCCCCAGRGSRGSEDCGDSDGSDGSRLASPFSVAISAACALSSAAICRQTWQAAAHLSRLEPCAFKHETVVVVAKASHIFNVIDRQMQQCKLSAGHFPFWVTVMRPSQHLYAWRLSAGGECTLTRRRRASSQDTAAYPGQPRKAHRNPALLYLGNLALSHVELCL